MQEKIVSDLSTMELWHISNFLLIWGQNPTSKILPKFYELWLLLPVLKGEKMPLPSEVRQVNLQRHILYKSKKSKGLLDKLNDFWTKK